MMPVNITAQWREDWSSASMVNHSTTVTDANVWKHKVSANIFAKSLLGSSSPFITDVVLPKQLSVNVYNSRQ